jgi:hypothetical protein
MSTMIVKVKESRKKKLVYKISKEKALQAI